MTEYKIASLIISWDKSHDRYLPWRGEKNPYKVWVAEIILQQTRVEQGMKYYHRFIHNFPTVKDLADAEIDQLMLAWEGLGYYSRARNMHSTAKYIAYQCHGSFPENYHELLQLKGIGPYTAAAIASFAFGKPYAAVDGNVYRILSRLYNYSWPIDQVSSKKKFKAAAQQLLGKKDPAAFNQAMMNFGALICTPKRPGCQNCIVSKYCEGRKKGKIALLPLKRKKTRRKTRYFSFWVFKDKQGNFFLEKRDSKDIWRNMYQFPLQEHNSEKDFNQDPTSLDEILAISKIYKQVLTHQTIFARFFVISTASNKIKDLRLLTVVKKDKLRNFAFPKIINCYLDDNWLN